MPVKAHFGLVFKGAKGEKEGLARKGPRGKAFGLRPDRPVKGLLPFKKA
jgi:hypothetical protein